MNNKTILAMDTSGMTAAVALVRDGCLVGEYNSTNKKTHSQTLLPMIAQICQMAQQDPSKLDAIAVSSGPGSFTGLRIGSATAKGMAFAIGCPIVEVPTLEGLACNLSETEGIVVPMMDARRSQVYTAIYRFRQGNCETLADAMAVPVQELIEQINTYGEAAWLLGDGAVLYREELSRGLRCSYHFAPVHLNLPKGSSIAFCGLRRLEAGLAIPGSQHKPEYLRPSQAEREREARKARQESNEQFT
ncbi:MAG: tRNA (adenosine(37)-N6)-threonylcarbamoyltransferase complex dimerization subunit type 1 TsaB [Lachnospiraceae bacterium]|nr:tRNA (adenosine(37)-N6)-threonylcarbamoyltransferase complex dimerization subunit type 1 TsaB [Lachnospiraceae bacterium]